MVLLRAFSTGAAKAPFRLAVVGSGPAGFYASHRVLRDLPNAHIDMFDSLPVPHGLVRFGVAPDHPEVKNVMSTFDRVAEDDRFRFLGNVTVGGQPGSAGSITVDELKQHYDALLFSYGASEDRRLGVVNEDAYGVDSARAFVAWYNGLPGFENLKLPLDDTDTAVVIGQGNVALDCARILLSPIDVLRKTDITEYALEALSKSRIRHVHVVGRRGPVQAAFTAKELREQMNLPNVAFKADYDWIKAEIAASKDFVTKSRPLKRLMGILEKGSPLQDAERTWTLEFLRSPHAIRTTDDHRVRGIEYEINRLEGPPEQRRAVGTGEYTSQECGLVLRSIGYKSVPMEGVPFDARQGRVPNTYGKIVDNGQEVPGMYTAGWLKRGPTGVIVSTMSDAYETADTLAQDVRDGKAMLPQKGDKTGATGLSDLFKARNIRPVSYLDWKKIEAAEFAAGEALGKPREKLFRVQDMLAILDK
ncbi:hypothetical protein BCR43DRAFT_524931 [Syncephalastrum racemosum]|uniref:NADPH:adrenodoxin oxidoreductase, mitochondrial n=1 Tax=Syncephalastrum racemosum TaxID=13706 RepID=A0A1X2HDM5_SYNRA|nr:hypothetical protein BCR43DRAFT_524931 [Syncephalastrum racemosum]